jgi:hypothetical protein
MTSTNYEARHYAVFSSLLLLLSRSKRTHYSQTYWDFSSLRREAKFHIHTNLNCCLRLKIFIFLYKLLFAPDCHLSLFKVTYISSVFTEVAIHFLCVLSSSLIFVFMRRRRRLSSQEVKNRVMSVFLECVSLISVPSLHFAVLRVCFLSISFYLPLIWVPRGVLWRIWSGAGRGSWPLARLSITGGRDSR